jgi:hypothetical protein
MTEPKAFPSLGKWPPGAGEPQQKSRTWDFCNDGPIASFDVWERAMQRKVAAQAAERKRLGLPPADIVDFGCQGEPKVDD